MTNSWLFQLSVSIIVILSISVVVKRLLKITLSKSLLISISLITLLSMLLNTLGIYKLSINILIIISIIPIFFSSIRRVILEEKSLIIEFILVILAIFYFSHDRILMDEDELYFWAIKYKYFVSHFDEFNNFNFDNIKEPYENTGYGNATALFQSFITSFIGYNEGGAIFANNIIITCSFYFLFADRVKKPTHRFIYFSILYLVLNNLSFGFLSIYSDPIITTLYAILIYYLINDFDYKKLKSIILLLILLLFFIQVHRISLLFISFLPIILFIKNYKNQKNLNKFFLYTIFFIIFFYLIITYLSSYSFNLNHLLYFNLYKSDFFIKTIFLSKSYNSQFGVSYNEIINYLKIDLIKLPEYVWHNFIWYFVCLTLTFINGKKAKELNIFFLIIFCIFSCVIIINKIYVNDTSPQVFGRYISFILIPHILSNLLYLNFFTKKKYVTIFLIMFSLILSTPKKTFGFFFTQDFYKNYDQWNKDYYEVRNKHKNLFNILKDNFEGEISDIILVFKDGDIRYDAHPSLYQSALKLDLYPHNTNIITSKEITYEEYNIDYYFKDKNILISYNLDINDKKVLKNIIKRHDIKIKKIDFKLSN